MSSTERPSSEPSPAVLPDERPSRAAAERGKFEFEPSEDPHENFKRLQSRVDEAVRRAEESGERVALLDGFDSEPTAPRLFLKPGLVGWDDFASDGFLECPPSRSGSPRQWGVRLQVFTQKSGSGQHVVTDMAVREDRADKALGLSGPAVSLPRVELTSPEALEAEEFQVPLLVDLLDAVSRAVAATTDAAKRTTEVFSQPVTL